MATQPDPGLITPAASSTIAEVVAQMEQIDAALPRKDGVAMWSIASARALAWDHAELLWQLRDDPVLADAYGDFLARLVELSGRGILV